jgi:hypothetical protein
VSQSIYEHARRAAACVADWSAYSPSVFVEFGVRQAVSDWGAVSIVDTQFAQKSDDSLARSRAELDQVPQLHKLFGPIEYSTQSAEADFEMATALVNRNPAAATRAVDHSRCRGGGWSLAARVADRFRRPVAAADASAHERGQVNAAGSSRVERLKVNSEDAAAERRIAAWLYLHKRENADALPEDDPRKKAYYELGQVAAAALYAQFDRGRPESLDLALYIEEEINRSRSSGAQTKTGED